MAKALVLLKFTEAGVRALPDSPARAKAFAAAAAQAGLQVEQQFWTVGAYDGALILSAPGPLDIVGCVARLASMGNVSTQTLPALDEAEFRAALAKG